MAGKTKTLATDALLKLEVPIVVRLGEREMTAAEILGLIPGSMIELDKPAEDELDLMANQAVIGTGTAIKIGENFGLRVSFVGDVRARLEAMSAGGMQIPDSSSSDGDDMSAEDLAAMMLEGQV